MRRVLLLGILLGLATAAQAQKVFPSTDSNANITGAWTFSRSVLVADPSQAGHAVNLNYVTTHFVLATTVIDVAHGGTAASTPSTARRNLSIASTDISWPIEQPTVNDSGVWQHKLTDLRIPAEISCDTNAGGSATINLEVRARATPNVAGTMLLAAPLTCGPTVNCGTGTGCTTTFALSSIPANSLVAPVVVSVSATMLRVHLNLQP